MQNRTRNKQMIVRFTEDEFKYFKKKKELSKVPNYTDFILKLLTHTKIFVIDTLPLLDLTSKVESIGRNINQIARAVNTNGKIYKNDIEDLQNRVTDIENILYDIFQAFAKASKWKILYLLQHKNGFWFYEL